MGGPPITGLVLLPYWASSPTWTQAIPRGLAIVQCLTGSSTLGQRWPQPFGFSLGVTPSLPQCSRSLHCGLAFPPFQPRLIHGQTFCLPQASLLRSPHSLLLTSQIMLDIAASLWVMMFLNYFINYFILVLRLCSTLQHPLELLCFSIILFMYVKSSQIYMKSSQINICHCVLLSSYCDHYRAFSSRQSSHTVGHSLCCSLPIDVLTCWALHTVTMALYLVIHQSFHSPHTSFPRFPGLTLVKFPPYLSSAIRRRERGSSFLERTVGSGRFPYW